MSAPDDPLLLADPKTLAGGAAAMLAAQADLAPAIIHTLRVLLNRASYPPDHVKWVETDVRTILARWEKAENLQVLKTDLGLDLPKKRRKALTVRRETAIAVAIVGAALSGEAQPKRVAADKLQAEDREVQRAWKAWKTVYLARLELAAVHAKQDEAQRIRSALDRLSHLK